MNKKKAMEWVEALRSGEYKQGKPTDLKSDTGYCCLGVLCEINGLKFKKNNIDGIYHTDEGSSGGIPFSLMKKLNIRDQLGCSAYGEIRLYHLNDSGIYFGGKVERLTFDEIADIIQVCYKEL